MGTEVDCKSSFEGYYSMRDVNEDSNSSSWPLFYGEKSLSNSHYYNGFIPRPISDDKDALKQKMLEHEAIFKNQVHELHRLYIRQRDMMEEVKRKDLNKHHNSIDASSSSSFLPSQKPYEDNHNHKWQMPTFPCSRPSIFGAEISNSPLSCSKGNNNNNNINNNDHSSKDCEIVECGPSKVRKKLFDLELPPDENMENEEYEGMQCKQVSEESSFRGSNGLADLNEPVHVDEPVVHGFGPSAKPHVGQFFDQRHEFSGRPGGVFNPILVEGKGNGRDWLSNTRETGNSRSNMNFTPGTYSEISRIQDHGRFNQTHHLPFPTSRASTSYPHANSSNFGSSWEKANGSSLTHKLTSFQKQQQQQQPSLLSSPQSHVVVGDRWQQTNGYNNNINNNNNNNNIPNGFYRGSSSGSKEPCARFPSSVLDDNIRSQKILRGSNFIDLMESTKGMDLNTVEETVSNRCNQSVFPWLQSKPAICKNDSLLVNNRKFPGFENSCVSEIVKIKKEIEPRGFDINVAWDDDDPENKQIDEEDCKMENEKIKNHFDLNSCVTEDEEITVPESLKCLKKTTMEIDLEAPAVPETEEDEEEEAIDEVKKLDEELAMVAAEAMVAIFSQTKSTSDVAVCSDDEDKDRLLWFAEVIGNAGPGCNEVDEYEELTLKLEMTKEQDYMPKPLAPDYFQEPDEAGPSMGPLRPRRGQARRGRPRRDFQRDILPGLVSLSRHEVTEDLQIFGGLMRATGHSWNVGLTRRNGTRGRRKSVVAAVDPPPVSTPPPPPPPPPPPLSEQLGNLEVVGLDERSLTGWGKTTRRPRRQRCGTGSSVAVPLT